MKNYSDPRHNARILAIQKLFEADFSTPSNIEEKDLLEFDEIEYYDKKLYSSLLSGISQNKAKIDQIIQEFADERPLNEIMKTDLQILRIAVYEAFEAKITPPKVAIDEAIELSKIFSGTNSSAFVNGVLDSIFRNESKK